MNKRKLLMALVGACLACNVAMANAAGVEYMGAFLLLIIKRYKTSLS